MTGSALTEKGKTMRDLIDRQTAIENVTAEMCSGMWCNAINALKRTPTIDAVHVVRCGKCKWFDYGTTCIRFGIRMSRAHDDFCSYGKWKADE